MSTKQRSEETLTPDEARAAVTRLKDELAAAKVDAEKSQTAVETIMGTIGDRVLDARAAGDNAAEVAAQGELTSARTEIEVAERIVDALGKRITEAEKAVHVADARALRDEARRLWAEVAPHLAESNAMLDALAEREGTRFLPWPVAHPSGAYANGSWSRTVTGAKLGAILELEREAAHIESRAGIAPQPSLLEGVAGIGLHLGCGGTVEAAVPIKVSGSQLDGAAASLRGERPEPPDGFAALRAELKAKGVQVRG